jgi:hypothetical protein
MFQDYNKTKQMIEGSYKKIKSYFHYDKTLLHNKLRIAQFESENFDDKLDNLINKLVNQDVMYFEGLINTIDFKVLPKKFVSRIEENDVVKSNVDHRKDIEKVNFFIDMPIELYIIDLMWTLFIGKIYKESIGESVSSYAAKFKKSLFSNERDLFLGIDFQSNRCFDPYYNSYSTWRDKAFKTVKDNHNKLDTLMMTIDLKSFYYSVEFKFDSLRQLLGNDERLNSIDFLTCIIQKIYTLYTQKLSKYKKGIKNIDDSCIFPIGMFSPLVLSKFI